MYCVYRILVEEYVPGKGWCDDGYLYSTDKAMLQSEAWCRVTAWRHDRERFRCGDAKIVVVHETFLRDLKITPVLSTIQGTHPADFGLMREYSAARRSGRLPPADVQYLKNTNVPSRVE
jgi:hypothetical protein